METWQLQEAKSRFSELVDRALSVGPQMVTRRGHDAVVVMSATDYQRLNSAPSLMHVLLNAPRGPSLYTRRSAEKVRKVSL